MRASIRSSRKPHNEVANLRQRDDPAAWKVATTGHVAEASAATEIAGVNGSCTCRRSNRSRASVRCSRTIAEGLRTMFARE